MKSAKSKIAKSIYYHTFRSRLASRIHPFISPSGFISLSPKSLFNFLLNLYITPCVGKIFKFMEFTFLENALNLGTQNSTPSSSCRHILGRSKILIPPGSVFSKICFSQQQKGEEETMICFIKIQSENMKLTRNIRLFIFCMICNFFKCDGFTVFK